MANLFRMALAAALMFGVVAAPGQSARPVATIATAPVDDTLFVADSPVIADEPEIEAVVPDVVEPLAPAARSLAELVQRHEREATAGRDMECLAGAVYFEAKGEPLAGQLAVANVIRNRARSGRFAPTICGVIHQRGQFSFVRGGSFPPIARASRGWAEATAIAHVALNELWASPVERALFFHARRVSPGWRLARLGTVGNHVFYR